MHSSHITGDLEIIAIIIICTSIQWIVLFLYCVIRTNINDTYIFILFKIVIIISRWNFFDKII